MCIFNELRYSWSNELELFGKKGILAINQKDLKIILPVISQAAHRETGAGVNNAPPACGFDGIVVEE